MSTKLETKVEMKTITKAEIQKLIKEGFSVRRQSNDLVFVGKKKEHSGSSTEKIKFGVSQEEVYRLI